MNYAKTHHLGHDTIAPRAKASPTASAVRRIRPLDAKDEGRRGNAQRPTAVCTENPAPNAFLSTAFLPKLAVAQTVDVKKRPAKVENDFYNSLLQLCSHYGITPLPTHGYSYPYNIALSLWDAQRQLKAKVRGWQEIRLIKGKDKAVLTCEEGYNTGSTLYYVPIVPLYLMLRNPARKRYAVLLLSVCSYLYHVADLPYYRQEDSFLYWQYQMLTEWVTSDDYCDETPCYLGELEQAQWVGERMFQKLSNTANLQHFERRIHSFIPQSPLEADCLKIAREAYALSVEYPDNTIFSNAPTGVISDDDQEDEENQYVTMDRYISFCATSEGWLSDNIVQCVNAELQEYAKMQEPVVVKSFDGSDENSGNSLDFEYRLFALMEELIGFLSNL